eukprot:comp15754_c0_seq1/m.12966 comp15754_c0_seq1/g.12966  ORF comp15754_c0_seq1/g.12966 comp15754_c0_seq1/m.12966 type:complete len:527 (-) comp15754_c0_seq1:850-2430(-)
MSFGFFGDTLKGLGSSLAQAGESLRQVITDTLEEDPQQPYDVAEQAQTLADADGNFVTPMFLGKGTSENQAKKRDIEHSVSPERRRSNAGDKLAAEEEGYFSKALNTVGGLAVNIFFEEEVKEGSTSEHTPSSSHPGSPKKRNIGSDDGDSTQAKDDGTGATKLLNQGFSAILHLTDKVGEGLLSAILDAPEAGEDSKKISRRESGSSSSPTSTGKSEDTKKTASTRPKSQSGTSAKSVKRSLDPRPDYPREVLEQAQLLGRVLESWDIQTAVADNTTPVERITTPSTPERVPTPVVSIEHPLAHSPHTSRTERETKMATSSPMRVPTPVVEEVGPARSWNDAPLVPVGSVNSAQGETGPSLWDEEESDEDWMQQTTPPVDVGSGDEKRDSDGWENIETVSQGSGVEAKDSIEEVIERNSSTVSLETISSSGSEEIRGARRKKEKKKLPLGSYGAYLQNELKATTGILTAYQPPPECHPKEAEEVALASLTEDIKTLKKIERTQSAGMGSQTVIRTVTRPRSPPAV